MADQTISASNGRKVQVRDERQSGWTVAKRRVFLDHLATTCNVRQSAAAVGMTETGVYALRRRDPAFAAQWQEAIRLGYETIETLLLSRALAGTDTAAAAQREPGDPVPPSPASIDRELAVMLLNKHRDAARATGKRGGPPLTMARREELIAALTKRIMAVKRRREGQR